MGGTSSSSLSDKPFADQLDYIAAHFILTQNFQDMQNLASMDYCNKLIIITSDVLKQKVPNIEIDYLWRRQQTVNGKQEEVNEKETDTVKVLQMQKAATQLDVQNKTQKRRMCVSIAKHYVLIAHLFAAIITTVNPTYTVKGQRATLNLQERSEQAKLGTLLPTTRMPAAMPTTRMPTTRLPTTRLPTAMPTTNLEPTVYGGATERVNLSRLNLCSRRLNALTNSNPSLFSETAVQNMPATDTLMVKPNFCSYNATLKNVMDEPGFPELEKLYYDKYDDDAGGFKSMTPESEKQYLKDVETVYKAFTSMSASGSGSSSSSASGTIPKRFRDIKLREFGQYESCQANSRMKLPAKDKVLLKYADKIRTMLQHTEQFQKKLLETIDVLFKVNLKSDDKDTVVRINPVLTEQDIQGLIVKTRKTILELYTTCEQDFLETVNMFETVVHMQVQETGASQDAELDKTVQSMVLGTAS